MSTHEQTRRAHRIVDALKDSRILSSPDVDFLRSFLPELPKQKTLEEICKYVDDAWPEAGDPESKEWLHELHAQLQGLKDTPAVSPAKPAHPEFLETEADYQNAPEGTVVARDGLNPWVKEGSVWMQGTTADATVYRVPCLKGTRRVLRWGK